MIRKTKAIFIKSIKTGIAYKFEFWVWAGILSALFLLQYFIWTAIFTHTGVEQIRGFTLQQTILYYGLAMIVGSLTYYDVYNFEWLVRSGSILVRLVKPIHYLLRSFMNFLGSKVLNFTFQIIPLSILIWLVLKPKFELAQLCFGALSILLAMQISFLFWWIIGRSAVWLIKSRGLIVVIDGFIWVASGALVPLAFFPQAVQKVLAYMPFQYVIYVPTKILLGQITVSWILHILFIQILWIIILLVLALFIWNKAIQALEAVGV